MLPEHPRQASASYRLIATGAESYSNEEKVRQKLLQALEGLPTSCNVSVITGMLSKTDDVIIKLADDLGVTCLRIGPNSRESSKLEIYARNERMVGFAQEVLAFHDDESPTIKHLLDAAHFRELPIKVVR